MYNYNKILYPTSSVSSRIYPTIYEMVRSNLGKEDKSTMRSCLKHYKNTIKNDFKTTLE